MQVRLLNAKWGMNGGSNGINHYIRVRLKIARRF
jgi:hypothetical protein